MKKYLSKKEIIQGLMRRQAYKRLSAWDRGVNQYAQLIIYNHGEEDLKPENIEKQLLCVASSWHEYSYGGYADIYDYDIAMTLCTPSELKRTDNGIKAPNRKETWLDVQ